MVAQAFDRPDLRVLAPLVIGGLRRMRGVSVPDMAKAMGIARRTYENFEKGKGRLNVARVHHFAALLNADPYAILDAFEIRSPELALRCANNKMMMIHMMALEAFDAKAQDLIVGLDALDLLKRYTMFYDSLVELGREQADVILGWRAARAAGEARTPPEAEGPTTDEAADAPDEDPDA